MISEVNTVLIKDEMFEEDQTQQRLFIRDGGEWMKKHKLPIINVTDTQLKT